MTARPRVSHACHSCRQKKVRCDLARPSCTRCAGSLGSVCVYDQDSTSARDYQFVQIAPHASRSQSSAPSAGRTSMGDVTVSTTRLQSLEEKLERLTAQVQALQGRSKAESSTMLPSEQATELDESPGKKARTITSEDTTEALQESAAGHLLVQPDGRHRYVSRGHWAAMCEEAGEIEMLLRGQTRYNAFDPPNTPLLPHLYGTILSTPPVWDISSRVSSKARPSAILHTLQIPDRKQCDALFEAYASYFHPVVPLTHIPTLRKDYELLWDLRQSREPASQLQTVTLILAALYAGAVVCLHLSLTDAFPGTDIERVAIDIYQEAINALHAEHFPRVPTVASLSAYMILQGTWMRDEEPLTTCSFVGVTVRVAQMLGLHKDPSHFKITIGPIQAEIQRRVWWQVFHCDVLVAMASGLPPLIERNSWDTMTVSDLYEDKIGTWEGLRHDEEMRAAVPGSRKVQETSPLVSPMGIWIQGKFQETLFVRKLLDKAFHQEQMTMTDMISARNDLQLLRRDMRDRSRRISTKEPIDTYENNYRFNTWARIILVTLGDKNWWFLYTPLLHRSITQAWHNLIPNLQLYCCAFLEQYVVVCCAREFTGFQWAWPGNHQPLHALVLVLKEIERNPMSEEVDVSCAIVNQVMALSAPEGGITGSGGGSMMQRPLTEGGAEAWDFIRRLRARVWTKLGLDPDLTLTRDEVTSIVAQKMQAFEASGGKLELRTPLPSDGGEESPDQHPLDPPPANATSTQPGAGAGTGTSVLSSAVPNAEETHRNLDELAFDLGGAGPTPNINWEDWDQIFNTGRDGHL